MESSKPSFLSKIASFNQWLLPYAVCALIATTILLPKFPILDVTNTYIKVRYDDLINFIVVVIWFLGMWWKRKTFFTNPLHQTIFLYWAVGLVSIASGILITQVIHTNLAVLNWLRRIEYMSMFFVGATAAFSSVWVARYVAVLLISSILSIIYGFGQVFLQWCSISTTNREFSKGICVPLTRGARPNATFAGHYDLAIFLSFLLPFIIGLFFAVQKNSYRIFLFLVFGASLWMLTVTQARMAFVATLVTVLALFWFYGKKWWLIGFVAIAVIFVSLFGRNLVTRYTTTAQLFLNRLGGTTQAQTPDANELVRLASQREYDFAYTQQVRHSAIPGEEHLPNEEEYKKLHPREMFSEANPAFETNLSTAIRLNEEWPLAIRTFQRNPLLGSGYSSMGIAVDNDYLRILGETGILGFVSFAFIFIILARLFNTVLSKHTGSRFDRGLTIGMSAAIISFLLNAMFIDVFEASKLAIIFWLFLGITVGTIARSLGHKTL